MISQYFLFKRTFKKCTQKNQITAKYNQLKCKIGLKGPCEVLLEIKLQLRDLCEYYNKKTTDQENEERHGILRDYL